MRLSLLLVLGVLEPVLGVRFSGAKVDPATLYDSNSSLASSSPPLATHKRHDDSGSWRRDKDVTISTGDAVGGTQYCNSFDDLFLITTGNHRRPWRIYVKGGNRIDYFHVQYQNLYPNPAGEAPADQYGDGQDCGTEKFGNRANPWPLQLERGDMITKMVVGTCRYTLGFDWQTRICHLEIFVNGKSKLSMGKASSYRDDLGRSSKYKEFVWQDTDANKDKAIVAFKGGSDVAVDWLQPYWLPTQYY